jgi:hypothetical protein
MPMLVNPVANNSRSGFLAGNDKFGDLAVPASSANWTRALLAGARKVKATAHSEIRTLQSIPIFSVPWKPNSSIKSKGSIVPATAPSTFDRYRKLKERGDSPEKSVLIASMATGIVAPIKAHHGINVKAIQIPEAK